MVIERHGFAALFILAASLCGGCAYGGDEAESDTGSQQAAVEVYRYRYGEEVLEASFDNSAGDRVLLDGPDNARIEALMNQPTSGVATDPTDDHTFWIYVNDAERTQVAETIRQLVQEAPLASDAEDAPLADASPSLSTKSLVPPGATVTCPGPYAALYQANNLGGGVLTMGPGQIPDLTVWSINDQTSSVYGYGGYVTLYEHQNYAGHSLLLNPSVQGINSLCHTWFWQVNALSSYTMISRWWWTDISWNDQASSVIFTVF